METHRLWVKHSRVQLLCPQPLFPILVQRMSLLKIVAYSVVSSLLSISMLFVKRCSLGRHGKSLLLKGHVGFVVLALTSLWSFWEDRREQGKVENRFGKMMNLTSTGAFSLMALSLSWQLQLGLEVGVTNFLVGCFLVTLMKMNFKLAPLAALFCYLLFNIRSISDSLLVLRARAATHHADDHKEEPSLKDLEANSNDFANDTTVAGKKELGELKGAVVSSRSGEILVLKKYRWNDILSILSPKNIAKSKAGLFLNKCGCEVRKIFLQKKFKDDTDKASFQDREANSDVFEREKNEANFEGLETNSDDVFAHDTNEANFQDHEANSDVSEYDKNEANFQDLKANSNVLARDTDEPNFQDPKANSDVFARDTNEEKFEDIEANSNVLVRDTDEPSSQDPEANSDNLACDTNETNFQEPEANSDVCVHETYVASLQHREAYSDEVFEGDIVAGREIVIKNGSRESKEADSLSSSEISVRGLKYENGIQNILSMKNIGKSKEVSTLKKFGNGVGNLFTPKNIGKSKEVSALKKFGNGVGNLFTPKKLHDI